MRRVVRTVFGPVTEWAQRGPVELARVGARLGRVEASQVDVEIARQGIESNRINGELLKGEVREIDRKLHEVGMAFAPGTGIDGAGVRFAELREQVNALERRLRRLDAALDLAPDGTFRGQPARSGDEPNRDGADAAASSEVAPAVASAFTSELFNYVAFERRFRGDPATILATQTERYADLLAGHGPVVDVGCGRGELLEVLQKRGVECIGVEPDAGMVAEARARGLHIEHTDAIAFLRAAEPGSIGALFSAHVAEHVPIEVLLEMIELAASRIAPGGLFVAETPNPASLIVLGNSFILDPTHIRPIHPSLFAFLCETAGFRDVRLQFYAPAEGYHLEPLGPDAPEWARVMDRNVAKLNTVLFGPQEYVVIATTPPTIDS